MTQTGQTETNCDMDKIFNPFPLVSSYYPFTSTYPFIHILFTL